MRVMVTGGAGFIGSNLIHHILHKEEAECCPERGRYPTLEAVEAVVNVDALTYAGNLKNLKDVDTSPQYSFSQTDICDQKSLGKVVKKFEPDVILNLAAESHVDRSIEDGSAFIKTNVLGTQIVADAARRHDVPSLIQVSTDEVYGSYSEGTAVETDPYDPSSPYSASKAGADLLVLAHHRTYGLPVDVTRCTNNYGPRQHPEKLIPVIISKAFSDQPIPIYGDGSNIRDWLYVQDHCAALAHIMKRRPAGKIHHISADDERNNLDVVKTILRILGKPESLIQFVSDRPGHDQRYSLDSTKLRSDGWSPRVPFNEGVEHTVSQFQAIGTKEVVS